MSKLTEMRESFARLTDVIYSAGMDEESEELQGIWNMIVSLLEEKDKALAFYADETIYEFDEDYGQREALSAAGRDCGLIARKALNTSSNNEGEV